ncbi:MAG: sodium:proton antiporter [Methylococcales bacterium]|nr:sodium:proton antiporter [Methylococcales bacterium]
MNLDIFLSLFFLMMISLVVFMLAKKLRLPYTVLLVIAGSLLVPLTEVPFFSFISSFKLTPELLFFVFLPILIFESAYNIKINEMISNYRTISLMAIFGLLISTVFIGMCLHYVFAWINFPVPIPVTLLFGAIISATDPVAVLALFKDYGAPKRLTLIFEGESLLNDGTAFALFLVFLEIITHGYAGTSSIGLGVLNFFMMLFGGILFGLLMGFLFAKLIEWVRGYEHLEITLTLLVAHLTFILTEVISEHIIIGGIHLRFSSIIATMVAAIVIGNFGRYKMSHDVEDYMERFWGYFGFVTNSLVFILMGLLFVEQSIDVHVAILPIVLAIITVVIARALSIYPILGLFNWTRIEEPIPASWMHLLSWGSLRGSLAVIMVLLIPDDATLPNWSHDFSVKDFVTAITIGCIYFTLLVKATTIGKVMNRLKIDALTDYEQIGYYRSKGLIYDQLLETLEKLNSADKISTEQYQTLKATYTNLYQAISKDFKKHVGDLDVAHLMKNLLVVYVLGLERAELKEIYQRGEINEKIYKKILNLLDIQIERAERGHQQVNAIDEKFPLDVFESLINRLKQIFLWRSPALDPQDLYIYYRTELKLLELVIERLDTLPDSSLIEIFNDHQAIAETRNLYQRLIDKTRLNLDQLVEDNYALLDRFNVLSAQNLMQVQQLEILDRLHKSEIITQKLYIMLRNELSQETRNP